MLTRTISNPGYPPLATFMGVPLFVNKKVFAVLGIGRVGDHFGSGLFEVLKPLFELCGEMIQKVNLAQELEAQKKMSIHQAKLASIGELAAGIGHEINNPLAIIQGQTDLLINHIKSADAMDEFFEDNFSKIIKSVDRISHIVKGLRSFARQDALDFTSFNASEMFIETAEMLIELYNNDGISLIFEVEPNLWVNGSRGRIQQVLVNLLNNARDALLGREKRVINFSCRKVDQFIEVVVHDSGPGIPESLHERIFNPFFTTKDVNKGTGMGLALSASIIREHDGFLRLDVKNDVGARFLISLPAQAASVDRAVKIDDKKNTRALKFSGTVLVVDDEPDLCEILKGQLEKFGLDVLTATSGAEGLERFQENKEKIDLVICDVNMPVMNGPIFALTLRKIFEFNKGLLFITGGVNELEADYDRLVNGYLPKPFKEHHILETIKKWILPGS